MLFAPGLTSSLRSLEPLLLSEDPRDIHRSFRKLRFATCGAGSTGEIIDNAISAIEVALWDVLGQSFGVPIYRRVRHTFARRYQFSCTRVFTVHMFVWNDFVDGLPTIF